MVLYFCLIPNRGARIGHQTDDHFKLVAYCNKNNFIFVYHPFIDNSSIFENLVCISPLTSKLSGNDFNVESVKSKSPLTTKSSFVRDSLNFNFQF